MTNEEMYIKVKELLLLHASTKEAKEELAQKVALKSLEANHLYQDLGFESRTQMGKFMKKNFSSLDELKPKDSLWKKFIYDSIGAVAPACALCDDNITCFSCR